MHIIAIAFALTFFTPNVAPKLGEIGAHYFNGLNESQVWINLDPLNNDTGPNPVHLNVTMRFAGRQTPSAPKTVTIRAQADCSVLPAQAREQELTFELDGRTKIDLTNNNARFRFLANCGENSPNDTIIVEVPYSLLVEISKSSVAHLDALGFSTHLTGSDLSALRQYVQRIGGGAAIKGNF